MVLPRHRFAGTVRAVPGVVEAWFVDWLSARGRRMGRTGRWLLVVVGSLVVFGLCVLLGDLLLPWDQSTRIGTGAGAGAVVAGVLGAWSASLIGSSAQPTATTPGASSASTASTASGDRSVATQENSGVIITGDNGTVQR